MISAAFSSLASSFPMWPGLRVLPKPRRSARCLVCSPGLAALVAIVAAGLLSPVCLRADTAVLPSGERVAGRLQFNGGRWGFVRSDNQKALTPTEMAQVRFPNRPQPTLRVASVHRLLLPDGQQLTGALLGLDQREVRFRTIWKNSLVLPRAAVQAVTQLPGYATMLVDDFAAGLTAWKLTGSPKLSEQNGSSGRQSLCLDGPGQSAELAVAEPLTAGRLGINFCSPKVAQGAAWWLELHFEGTGTPDPQVLLADKDGTYQIRGNGAAATPLAASPGWHRLFVDFGDRSLSVAVDERILWLPPQPSAYGPLRSLRLSCVGDGSGKRVSGEVYFDDLSLARRIPLRRRPPGDSHQDELWLLSGDQLFGAVASADSRAIQFRLRSRARSLKWADVRGIYFRAPAAHSSATARNPVRISLRSGASAEPDELEGAVLQYDDQHLVLRHATLGDLTIETRYLHRLRWPSKEQ